MGRAPCCSKDAGLNRGAWNAEEDSILTKYISTHGEGGWKYLPQKAGLKRCGKSCRLRWLNYLRPDIKRGNISADEDELIIRMHKLLGNRWSLIAGRLPCRTDNEIKNYWNTQLMKKLESQENSPPKTREICRTLKTSPSCSEDHRSLRNVAVRTTAIRLPKKVADIISQHQESKLQRELSEFVNHTESYGQFGVDKLITGSDFKLLDHTVESESSPVDHQFCTTTVLDHHVSDCPNVTESEVATSCLTEMCSPEDNFPWSPYNSLTEESINELQYLNGMLDDIDTQESINELQYLNGMLDDIDTEEWINELQYLKMSSLFQD